MVHCRSVPAPHLPTSFSGEGGVSGQKPLYIIPCRIRPPSPFIFQFRPYCPSHLPNKRLIYPRFSPRGDCLVDESPRHLRNPRVVARRPFFLIRDIAPQLHEDIFHPRPRLTSRRKKREAHPTPEVMLVFPRGGDMQTPQYHVVVGVVPRVPDSHVLKYLSIGPQNIVHPVPHLPTLSLHRPRSLVLIPRSLSWE